MTLSEENLNFWVDVRDYTKMEDSEEMKSKAYEIYDSYFKAGASNEINVPYNIKEKLHHLLEDDFFDPTPDLYDDALTSILVMLQNDSFERFIRSEFYERLRVNAFLNNLLAETSCTQGFVIIR